MPQQNTNVVVMSQCTSSYTSCPDVTTTKNYKSCPGVTANNSCPDARTKYKSCRGVTTKYKNCRNVTTNYLSCPDVTSNLFCGPTQEPVLAIAVSHSQHRKKSGEVRKKLGEWTGRVEISKEEIPGSKRRMYGIY